MKYVYLTLSLLFYYNLALSDEQSKSNPYTVDTLEMKTYLDNKIDYVVKTKIDGEVRTIYGYDKNDKFDSAKVYQRRNKVFTTCESNNIVLGFSRRKLQLSLLAVPIKVRPAIEGFLSNASAGLNNTGLNIDLLNYSIKRYFHDGSNSTHKFSLGVLFAPSVEELDSTFTRGFIAGENKSNQLFLSPAFTINYTYNGITFTYVPAGWDFGTTSTGKNWIYHKQRWWGFGIGIEATFLEQLFE